MKVWAGTVVDRIQVETQPQIGGSGWAPMPLLSADIFSAAPVIGRWHHFRRALPAAK